MLFPYLMVMLLLFHAYWNVLYCIFDLPNLAGGRPDESLTSSDSEKAVSVCVRVCVCVCLCACVRACVPI